MKPSAVIVTANVDLLDHVREELAVAGTVEVAAEAASAAEGIRVLNETDADIALIDMTLPDSPGIEISRATVHEPTVVFLAASDEHAMAAFDAGAVDYVRFPFTRERFATALRRAVERTTGRSRGDAPSRAPGPDRSLRRLFLKERLGIVPVPLVRVSRFEADGDYVSVHVGERRHLVRVRLRDLEAEAGERFLRVHRSHLVNLDHVRIFEHQEDGRLVVVMDDGTRILASRARSRQLRRLAH